MTASTTPSPSSGDAWIEEGRRAASVLDAVCSAVVVGRDAEAAASVALGLALAQATRRRVAIADLVGEVAPLQALVDPSSDPHGISDSFLYGVSLNKIAHQADASGNLFVLPSGSEAVATEDVFRSDRWRRLASGFREVGALLLLVARADTPGVDALAGMVDGIVIAGDASGALADAAPPLAVIAPTRRRPVRATADAPASTPVEPPAPARAARRAAPPEPPADQPAPRNTKWRLWLAIAVMAVAIAGVLNFWVFPRRTGIDGDVPRRVGTARATAAPAARPDSAADSMRVPNDTTPAAATGPLAPLTVANPADSANAVLYSVYITGANSVEGAMTALDARTLASMPSVALSPVLQPDGEPLYRLSVGAFAARAQAESLLVSLQRRGLLAERSGLVVRAPYALLVEDRVSMADVLPRTQAFLRKDVVVYSLSRGDGTAALYAGAFERPEQAAWLARALRQAGVSPTLVFRTGRSL